MKTSMMDNLYPMWYFNNKFKHIPSCLVQSMKITLKQMLNCTAQQLLVLTIGNLN
jgi:hypothetical protein